MLTRKKPFQGENMTAVTHKIVYDAFQPPEEIVKDMPKGLSALLTRCLEKDPNRRFPRASEVARDVRGVIAAQQALDDTVATQEVELEGAAPEGPEAAPPADAAAAPPPTPAPDTPPMVDLLAAPTTEIRTVSEVAPTRIIERPPLPATPPPAAAAPLPVPDNAPTQHIARPPIQEFRAALASPPKPAPTVPLPPPAAPAPAPPGGGVAATVLSAVPRATKSAPPPPPSAASPAPAAAPAPAPKPAASAKSRRSLLVAAGALILVGLVGGAALWVTREPTVAELPAAEAPAPAPEQQSRVTAAAAISEARTYLASGNLEGALQAVARAELAEPGNGETVRLREEIEARRQEIEEAARQAQIEERLKAARYAYAERRYSDAIAAARAVLAIDAKNDEARRIAGESDRAVKRLRERQAAVEAAQQAPAPAPEPPPQPAAPAIDPALLKESLLKVDFASERSEGVLTIYAGDRQVLREQFRFVRRTGFLAREKTSGTITATRKVPPGPLALKVYVTLPGKATRAILLEGDFPGGGSRTLVIRVDDDGNATAGLG
jgi:hypothetical protein